MKKHSIRILMILLLATVSLNVFAVQGALLNVRVLRTLVAANGVFGGCMALLDTPVNLATNSPNCPSNGWITFSCSATFTSQDIAYRMLDQAQLAKALGRPVTVVVDDTKKHNGFCFANRIDVN